MPALDGLADTLLMQTLRKVLGYVAQLEYPAELMLNKGIDPTTPPFHPSRSAGDFCLADDAPEGCP
jgi:hypothetical protein